ncbi:MAG: ABC transporter substrate-binding protein [Sporomusaceae bacterium]|nr:ABC transporter substrate-binding protein [Sporomusaceae bacterium]
MQHNGMIAIALLLLVILLAVAGCGSNTGKLDMNNQAFFAVTDATGKQVIVEKKPERIVVLSTSILDLLYAVDGKAVGRPNSKNAILPAGAEKAEEIGYVYNVNMEKVMGLKPDVVIAVQGMHEKLVPMLESNHIPVLILKYRTLEDTYNTLRILAKLSGTQEKGEAVISAMQAKIQSIVQNFSKDKPRKIVVLHATAKDVTVELPQTTAGSVAKLLGMMNIAEGEQAINAENDMTPFSLEKIVQEDPDDIFVVTMGKIDEIKDHMNQEMASSPAWSSLRAVKNQRVHYLPQDLFLLNPGIKMPEAVDYMAKEVR